ncbi:hypothetical protein Scep_018470 [Stephania cephalantha]|uniref:DNA polymerase V n=1 Tax=Stephania cephalantha TaxID=152367 RepID=A0AAP0NNT8_9MAGN
MGSKKRDSSAVAEVDGRIDGAAEVQRREDNHGESVSVLSSSVKPMERRKKRKQLDKEKHRAGSEKREVQHVRVMDEGRKAEAPQVSLGSLTSNMIQTQLHMSVFTDLASADSLRRQGAAKTLVMELEGAQNEYEKRGAGEAGLLLEAEKNDGLNNCARSLVYAIRRLIRGVSSSRECARQGFALGLTLLVSKFPCIKLDSLLKLITDLLEVSSSMKGQVEVRDCLLGRLFAYGAIARSGRMTHEWVSDERTPYVKEFTSLLISLSTKKRYLREPAVAVVLEMVEKLPVEALSSQVLEAPGMHEWFQEAVNIGNPDALLLALKMRQKISKDNEAFSKLLPYPFSSEKFFAKNHLASLVPCFKESTFCQPRVHGIWPVLIDILLPTMGIQDEDAVISMATSKKHKKSRKCNSVEEIVKNLRSFSEIVIEGSLLMSSHDRKHLAFDVLLLFLPRLPASCVQIALSHKLVHGLMDILSTKDTWLYKAAHHFLMEIVNWVRNDDDRLVAVIFALQKHSGGRFDTITRTKTVRDLLGSFNTEKGCMLFVQNLVDMFLDEGNEVDEPSDQSQTTDENSEMGLVEDKDSALAMGSRDILKSWVIDSLIHVLKDMKLNQEAEFRVQKEIMKFLAVQGLFSASLGTEVTSFELQEKFRWPKAATSSAFRQMCIEQLQLLLSNAQKGEGPSFNALEPTDLGSYFMRFLSTLCNIPSVSFYRNLSNEDDKAFKKLLATETRLALEERNMGPGIVANKLHALRYLLIQLVLQLLLRPGEFHEAASELVICCNKAFPSPDPLGFLEDDDDSSDDEPKLMDVLVDTMLSLLPQSSAPMRTAIEQVFKYFCGLITNAGLLRMLRVIKKDLKPARHQAISSDDDENEDDADVLDIDETGDADEVGAIGVGESDEEVDDSDAGAGNESGNESDEEIHEGSDDSDGGMDDDAMFRMDSYLAQMCRERKNQGGSESAHSQLALVNPNTMEASEQLGQRIWGILQKKVFKCKEYPRGETSTLESLLRRNLRLASKPFKKKKSVADMSKKKQLALATRQKIIASLAQQSTHWLLKIVHAKDLSEPELQSVLDIFRQVLSDFFNNKKSRLKLAFMKEVFQRQPWIGRDLFQFLLDECGSAKYEFRRVSSLELVEVVLRSLVSSKADEEENAAAMFLRDRMSSLSDLIGKLVVNMPKKQAWRAQVRKFCGYIFKVITTHNLIKKFLKTLSKDSYDPCASQLGDLFLSLKKQIEASKE